MRRIDQTNLILRRRRRTDTRVKRFERWQNQAGAALALLCSLILLSGLFLGASLIHRTCQNLPSVQSLELTLQSDQQNRTPTQIYDRSGSILIAEIPNYPVTGNYIYLGSTQNNPFPRSLLNIWVSVIQPDFWVSPGFHMDHWQDAQAVTLAEMLVQQFLLNSEEPGFDHTIRMRLLAGSLTIRYGKQQVLEWYLNNAYFGRGVYGIDQASHFYLGKPAASLNLAETALLLGVYQTPALTPFDVPDAAAENQKQVLDGLLSRKTISDKDYHLALQSTVALAPPPVSKPYRYPAFTHLAIAQAKSLFGVPVIERGGLRIISTLDVDLQHQTECVIAAQLSGLTESPNRGEVCAQNLAAPQLDNMAQPDSGSGLVMDPQTGQILALAGETGPEKSDEKLSEHPLDGFFSPVFAVSAFRQGDQSPSSLVWDLPGNHEALTESDLTEYLGPISFRDAVTLDRMIPLNQWRKTHWEAWQTTQTELSFLNSSHKTTGNLIDAAAFYSLFPAAGKRVGIQTGKHDEPEPVFILNMQSAGIQWSVKPAEKRFIKPVTAYMVHSVFTKHDSLMNRYAVPDSLKPAPNTAIKISLDEAQSHIWAMGYTPERLAVMWYEKSLQASETAFLNPSPAFKSLQTLLPTNARALPMPDGIVQKNVCYPSGLLPGEACPLVVEDFFFPENVPDQEDSLYQKVEINSKTGKLATIYTPLSLVEPKTYLTLPDFALRWGEANNIEQAPIEWDQILLPEGDPFADITSPGLFDILKGNVSVRGTAAGDSFQSYALHVGEGRNPNTWLEVAQSETKVNNGDLGIWKTQQDGIFVIRLSVLTRGQQFHTDYIQVMVDNTPPTVTIVRPEDHEVISVDPDEVLFFQALASDNLSLKTLQWMIDHQLLQQTTAESTSISWKPTPGQHKLYVIAEDNAGNQTTSEPITLTVRLK